MRQLEKLEGVCELDGSNVSILTSWFDGCTMVIKENALICRKFTLVYSGVIRDPLSHLFSNGKRKWEISCTTSAIFL